MTIRNDATRLRIGPRDGRRPRAVVSRQGQVLLDTDFDQQVRHGLDRVEIETRDVMGSPGRFVVPAGDNGFKITPSGAPVNFDIGQGHGYLAGWLLENVAPCKLGTQPHPRTGDVVGVPSAILVKGLVRLIDAAEETAYADVALGDAQASGRALNDWQVLPVAIAPSGTPLTCATVLATPDWVALVAPSNGLLKFDKAAAAPSTDPCSLTPGGGYTRLENLLYRIEVHGGDVATGFPTADGPRFKLHNLKLKLSRRNASMMVRISGIAGSEITVTPPALDPLNWFAPGLYAEIVSVHDDVDPRAALASERLFRVASADDSRVTLEATAAQIAATGATNTGDWFLRLWDSFADGSGIKTVAAPGGAMNATAIDLGDGLSIQLAGGGAVIFRRGDYWTCAARADGSIGWLDGGAAALQPPHGPAVHYAPLAVTGAAPAVPTFEDCRIPFATLTDKALLYRGGDGQSAFAPVAAAQAFVALAGGLRVAVMRGQTPVAGVRIRWSLVTGSPDSRIGGTAVSAASSPETLTDVNGLGEVIWAIDASQQAVLHRVQATLLDALPGTPPVVFSAMFESAARTSYLPGKCATLLGVDNVQDALDALCKVERPEIPKLPTVVKVNWRNDSLIRRIDLLNRRLSVVFSEPMDPFCRDVSDSIFVVEMELKLAVGAAFSFHAKGWIRQRVIVPGDIKWSGDMTNVTFFPTFNGGFDGNGDPEKVLLEAVTRFSYPHPQNDRAVRFRVTLKAHGFPAKERDEAGEPRALNGNILLAPGGTPPIMDFVAGGGGLLTADSLGPCDFESWFYLID